MKVPPYSGMSGPHRACGRLGASRALHEVAGQFQAAPGDKGLRQGVPRSTGQSQTRGHRKLENVERCGAVMRIPQRRLSLASSALGLVIVSVLAALVALALTAGGIQAQATVPAAPTGLAGSVSHDSVALDWNDPEDDSVTGYRVLRRSRDGDEYGDGGGAPEFVAVIDDTGSAAASYTDTSVTARTRYVYRVKAINSAGLSERSTWLNVETPAAPVSSGVPVKPTGLSAASVAHDSVALTWNDPEDDSITGYRVLRRSRDGDEYEDGEGAAAFVAVVDDTGSSAASYADTSVAARTRYVYRVQAINAVGLSQRSGYVKVETPAAPPPTPEPVTNTVVVVPPEEPEEPEFALQTDTSVPGGEVWDDNGVRRLRMFGSSFRVGSDTVSGVTYTGFASGSGSPVTIGTFSSEGIDFDSGSWGCPYVSGGPSNGLCSSTFTEIYFETDGETNTLLVRLSTTPAEGVPYGLAVRMPESTILVLDGVSFPVSHGSYTGASCSGATYENGEFCTPHGHTHFWRGVTLPPDFTVDDGIVTVELYRPDLSQ